MMLRTATVILSVGAAAAAAAADIPHDIPTAEWPTSDVRRAVLISRNNCAATAGAQVRCGQRIALTYPHPAMCAELAALGPLRERPPPPARHRPQVRHCLNARCFQYDLTWLTQSLHCLFVSLPFVAKIMPLVAKTLSCLCLGFPLPLCAAAGQ